MGDIQSNAARQRHLTFINQKTLASQMDRQQGCGARNVQRTTWATEIERMRNTSGKKREIVPKAKMKGPYGFNQIAVRYQVVDKVSIGAGPRPQPNVSGKTKWIIAGCLESFPAALHEYPLLRVHKFGFSWGNTKKMRVKIFYVFYNGSSFYVFRILQQALV